LPLFLSQTPFPPPPSDLRPRTSKLEDQGPPTAAQSTTRRARPGWTVGDQPRGREPAKRPATASGHRLLFRLAQGGGWPAPRKTFKVVPSWHTRPALAAGGRRFQREDRGGLIGPARRRSSRSRRSPPSHARWTLFSARPTYSACRRNNGPKSTRPVGRPTGPANSPPRNRREARPENPGFFRNLISVGRWRTKGRPPFLGRREGATMHPPNTRNAVALRPGIRALLGPAFPTTYSRNTIRNAPTRRGPKFPCPRTRFREDRPRKPEPVAEKAGPAEVPFLSRIGSKRPVGPRHRAVLRPPSTANNVPALVRLSPDEHENRDDHCGLRCKTRRAGNMRFDAIGLPRKFGFDAKKTLPARGLARSTSRGRGGARLKDAPWSPGSAPHFYLGLAWWRGASPTLFPVTGPGKPRSVAPLPTWPWRESHVELESQDCVGLAFNERHAGPVIEAHRGGFMHAFGVGARQRVATGNCLTRWPTKSGLWAPTVRAKPRGVHALTSAAFGLPAKQVAKRGAREGLRRLRVARRSDCAQPLPAPGRDPYPFPTMLAHRLPRSLSLRRREKKETHLLPEGEGVPELRSSWEGEGFTPPAPGTLPKGVDVTLSRA